MEKGEEEEEAQRFHILITLTWTNWTVRALFPKEKTRLMSMISMLGCGSQPTEGEQSYHSPTPPEPRITILYSRILEILADFSSVSPRQPLKDLSVCCAVPQLRRVSGDECDSRKIEKKETTTRWWWFTLFLMPFVALSLATLSPGVPRKLCDSPDGYKHFLEASLASSLDGFMQCYSAPKRKTLCCSTPRNGEKKNVQKLRMKFM